MTDELKAQLVTQLDSAMDSLAQEGMRGSLFAHLSALKTAVLSADVLGILTEAHAIIGHIIGKDHDNTPVLMNAAATQAFPWETFVPIILDLIRRFINR